MPRNWVVGILKVHPATVGRELARNADPDGHYSSHRAHVRARARRPPRGARLDLDRTLRRYVIDRLQMKWSLQQISR